MGKKHIKTVKSSIEELKQDIFRFGGFTEPSSATGKYFYDNYKPDTLDVDLVFTDLGKKNES